MYEMAGPMLPSRGHNLCMLARTEIKFCGTAIPCDCLDECRHGENRGDRIDLACEEST